MRGYGWIMLVIIEKKYLFILYLSIANINVREPNNVNTSGLIKINVKFEAKSVAGIRIPFSLSIPIWSQTAKIGIIYETMYELKSKLVSKHHMKSTVITIANDVCSVGYNSNIGRVYKAKKMKIGNFKPKNESKKWLKLVDLGILRELLVCGRVSYGIGLRLSSSGVLSTKPSSR